MKRKLIAVAAAALLGAAGLAAAPEAAAADQKAPTIIVLNQAQVLQQSKAGQSMQPQLEKLQKDASDDLNAQVEAFQKEEEDLKKQKDLIAQDVWTQKARDLAQREQNLPAVREQKVRELQLSEQKAYNVIATAMKPIIDKIAKDRGADLLFDTSNGGVMSFTPDMDITAEVIAELDKKLSTVTVEKVSLDDLKKQAEAAQAASDKAKKKK